MRKLLLLSPGRPHPQVQASGPGVEKTGCLVHQRADFTVSAKDAGRGPLKIMAQVWEPPLTFFFFLPPVWFPW